MRQVPALLILLCVACTAPSVSDSFIKAGDVADGVYGFEADMSDTLSTWSISLYTRLDASRKKLGACTDIPLEFEMVSPSGAVYADTLAIPLSLKGDSRWGATADFPVGEGLVPVEAGVWKLNLKPLADVPGFRGLGFVLKRNGTR